MTRWLSCPDRQGPLTAREAGNRRELAGALVSEAVFAQGDLQQSGRQAIAWDQLARLLAAEEGAPVSGGQSNPNAVDELLAVEGDS